MTIGGTMLAAAKAAGIAEPIEYRADGVTPVTRYAIVDRTPVSASLGQEARQNTMRVTVSADAEYGIDPSALDLGTATVALARRVGEAPQERRIRRIAETNRHTLTLEIG